jgi:hypothetical protein
MRLTFSKCPLRFRLRYQERLPEAPRGRLNLSLILHQTLESFLYNARRDSSLEACCGPMKIAVVFRKLLPRGCGLKKAVVPWKPSIGGKVTG